MRFNDVAIISVKENDYRILCWNISKNEAINTMKKSDLKKKNHSKKAIFFVTGLEPRTT